MRFAGKVALITAAANGIGRATAAIMVREGATVIAVDNHQGRLDEAVPALRQTGGKAEGKLVDALDAAQVDAVVAEVARDHGRIDILVNAVGGSTVIDKPTATTEQLTFDDWQKLIAFNLNGTFLFTHAVIPVVERRRRGEGRHHRIHPQARPRARARGHQRQCHRPQRDADRAHSAALGQALAGIPG
jgi:NAD(P)-dependent dehydrogenase (short-subunit alcohol dehydrogenase family)